MRHRPDDRLAARERRTEHGPLGDLTEREREVLSLMAEGHSNQAISRTLSCRPRRSRVTSARSS